MCAPEVLPMGVAQQTEKYLYKQVDTVALSVEVVYPEGFQAGQVYPSLFFFFGGGWIQGSPQQFMQQVRHFARQGVVSFLVDYRVASRHGTTPFHALQDAKSAMRFVRAHAAKFGVDSTRVVAVGGSAGGHLAAATAQVKGFEEPGEDASVPFHPNFLVLFNPVLDNGPGGYGFERIGEHYKDFSPLHNLHAGAPPTLIMLGSNDNLVPVPMAQYYQSAMQRMGKTWELHIYKGQPHGFFNPQYPEYYQKTLQHMEDFLRAVGVLPPTTR
jgi:acetyl esterase/lipase